MNKANKIYLYSAATILTNFGSSFSYFMLVMYHATLNQASVNSIFIASYTIVIMVATFFSGKVLDRHDKFKALVYLQIISGFSMLFYGFVLQRANNKGILFVLFMMMAIINGVTANIGGATTPFIAKESEEIYQINTTLQIGTRITGAIIGIISGVFIEQENYALSLYIDAGTYFVAALLYCLLFCMMNAFDKATEQNPIRPIQKDKKTLNQSGNNGYKDYFIYLFDHKNLLLYFIAIACVNVSFTPINTMLPYCFSTNGWGANYVGYVNTAYDIGGLFAAILLLVIKRNLKKTEKNGVLFLLITTTISYIVFSTFINRYVSIVGIAIVGFSAIQLLISLKSKIQIVTPKDMMGKGMAVQSIMLKSIQPIGMFVGAIWTTVATPNTLFYFMGGVLIILTVVYVLIVRIEL